jgi:aspartyl protease family protein
VVALFNGRAVVRTVDGEQMLKVGETSKTGVTLLAATPVGATVRYLDQIYDLDLSTRVAGNFTKPEQDVVRINRDDLGQYRMRGAIDDHPVNFLIDTGASVVAMSEVHAAMLGLNYQSGQRGSVQTAQGNANAYFVVLDKVTLGSITRHKVRATVIEGTYPVDVLLGMSFLNGVRLQDQAGVLTLTAHY